MFTNFKHIAEHCDSSKEKLGPLHGVPISVKDNYYIKGYDSTIGCSRYINKPSEDDAVVIKVCTLSRFMTTLQTVVVIYRVPRESGESGWLGKVRNLIGSGS